MFSERNLLLASLVAVLASYAAIGAELRSHRDIFRLPIPKTLPPHPRVFCTQADLDRIKADAAAGDVYTRSCIDHIRRRADACVSKAVGAYTGKPPRSAFRDAEALAQAYAVTGHEQYGRRCREHLLALAAVCPKLSTTRSSGRFTDSTLAEGPVAVRVAMAYDLIASAPSMSAEDRRVIERDLLRIIGWECGHGCRHPDSSNWRTWALAIVASCGFASGDRELIEEAVNGVYDAKRRRYLYGAVQQITHSIFSDGIHWERSIGYSYYTMSALMYVMVAAKSSGIDLWHAELPGLLGPFEGSANHEEYGPPGNRSVKALLDASFYYAFAGGSVPRYGDSGTRQLAYHAMYELAYEEYRDPKYAWLIRQKRQGKGRGLMGWQVWKPKGDPHGEIEREHAVSGRAAFRMRCGRSDRIGLVQSVTALADRAVRVSGRVKVLRAAGASAHIRCNIGGRAVFTTRVRAAGDWTESAVVIPAQESAKPGAMRSIRLHVFLEGGEGEAVWDDVRVTAGDDTANLVINGDFEAESPDGRPVSFWGLVHHPKAVPEGRYSLADDATIGLSGRHTNGSTLFPIGGFAVLRSDPSDPNAAAVNLAFGPYGSGHDHPDRLHFDLFGLGGILGPDAGSWGYDNPMHLTWANTTIAHNTVTVDETSQQPQGNSRSIWAGERGSQRVFGVLRLFHSGQHLKAVRATCDTAYPGVLLDRTLCLAGPYVLDVFRVSSKETHTYDLAFHGRGAAQIDGHAAALSPATFPARGYAHLKGARRGQLPAGALRAQFRSKGASVQLLHVQPDEGEIIVAQDPVKSSIPPTSCFIARRRGRNALFVSVLEPYGDQPSVAKVSIGDADGELFVTVGSAKTRDTFSLPVALDAGITMSRADSRGRQILSATAASVMVGAER